MLATPCTDFSLGFAGAMAGTAQIRCKFGPAITLLAWARPRRAVTGNEAIAQRDERGIEPSPSTGIREDLFPSHVRQIRLELSRRPQDHPIARGTGDRKEGGF